MPEKIHEKRHREWIEHQLNWKWLLDSYEGGDCYRYAIYGYDHQGYPLRNLVRHKREYDVAFREGDYDLAAAEALRDERQPYTDYGARLTRTPVPTFVQEVVADHLARIYAKEVRREIPKRLEVFQEDCDGAGTSFDHFMRHEVGPLLYTLGCIDILVDHPPAPDDTEVKSQADVARLGLDQAVASIVLPQAVRWWRLEPKTRRYAEVLIEECDDDPKTGKERRRYRHWTRDDWTLYDETGQEIDQQTHGFGIVPIIRLFDRRKPRHGNVGQSRLEAIAERQREFYNRDSELILSDSTQAHPLLQGPEDYLSDDGTIPVGPQWLLPKKKDTTKGTYEGFEVIEFPKGGADSIRENKQDLRDAVDRDGMLSKPAGSDSSGTVAQSGISKAFDHTALHNRLSELAETLADVETQILRLVLTILTDGNPSESDLDAILVHYSHQFDVLNSDAISARLVAIQEAIREAGRLPQTETRLIFELVAEALPGLDDATYEELRTEVEQAILSRNTERQKNAMNRIRSLAGVSEDDPDEMDDDNNENPFEETEVETEA